MKEFVIQVSNLSKYYEISHKSKDNSLRDSITSYAKQLWLKIYHNKEQNQDKEIFWALNDVSFEISEGEIVGVIGSNGAGKSTLLKILAQITEPSIGEVILKGRIASLLEVGTGFSPELTGRENIFLNGVILGMTHKEIQRKFDEIVDFSGVEKFLDTAVKHYSSGMYTRLAFAIAAHLEPEILLIDEVLSVGDVAFQKKCLGKIDDIAKHQGRTILFVSHNMQAVKSLCNRSLLVENGKILWDGNTNEGIRLYLGDSESTDKRGQKIWSQEQRPGNKSYKINKITLKNTIGNEIESVYISKDFLIEIYYDVIQSNTRISFYLTLFNSDSIPVFSTINNMDKKGYEKLLDIGTYHSTCRVDGNLLNAGSFYISIVAFSANWSDSFTIENAICFETVDDGQFRGDYYGNYEGLTRPKLYWQHGVEC
jgi:lipopolysaccharide transport system ATP-binding protein